MVVGRISEIRLAAAPVLLVSTTVVTSGTTATIAARHPVTSVTVGVTASASAINARHPLASTTTVVTATTSTLAGSQTLTSTTTVSTATASALAVRAPVTSVTPVVSGTPAVAFNVRTPLPALPAVLDLTVTTPTAGLAVTVPELLTLEVS